MEEPKIGNTVSEHVKLSKRKYKQTKRTESTTTMPHEIYSYSLSDLDDLENELQFSKFNSSIAWELGVLARETCQKEYQQKPIVIDITLVSGQTLFHTAVASGAQFDNDEWIRRKYKTTFRFGKSSFYMGQKLRGKQGKSMEEAYYVSSKEYAFHGGSVPLKLVGFDNLLGALTISGLAQEEDHLMAVKILKLYTSRQK